MPNPWFKDYSEYMSEIFPGRKIQKISVNAGLSCPNRDGTIGRGGCIYCVNSSFTPSYCLEGAATDVASQLDAGRRFFARKYPSMRYLAYFQSFTNTFAPAPRLEALYRQAMAREDVEGIVVGTRPDCLPADTVAMLGRLSQETQVFVELGVETSFDRTLALINRGHDWGCVVEAVGRLRDAGLRVGLHLIAGLPGEGPEEVLQTVGKCCELGPESLKLHQLQVLEGSALARLMKERPADYAVRGFELDAYLELCVRIVGTVPREICLERFLSQAPPEMVLSPRWGLKNHEFTNLLLKRLKEKH